MDHRTAESSLPDRPRPTSHSSRGGRRPFPARLLTLSLGTALLALLALAVPAVAGQTAPETVATSTPMTVSRVDVDAGPMVRRHRTGVVEMGVDGRPAPAPAPAPSPAPAPAPVPAPPSSAPAAPPTAEETSAAPPPPVAPAPPRPAPATTPATAPVTAAAPADSGLEGQVLALVNQERARAGCSAVVADSGLAAVARAHSVDMRDRGFFDHTNPDGLSPFDRGDRAGVTVLAENIAAGQPDAAAVMQAWMNSAGHRTNILNCSYRKLGVGVATGAGGPYWTQNFG